jgi:surface carbohydrate biosynthesis protein
LKNIDVVFVIEHVDRELDFVRLVAEQLRSAYGLSSAIISTFFHQQYLAFLNPRVFVFPYVLSSNDWPIKVIRSCYGNKCGYINLNWEQLLSKANLEYKRPRDRFTLNEILHFSWDDYFKRHLYDCGVSQKNVVVVGNPTRALLQRFVQQSPQLKNNLGREFDLDVRKQWLFFPMNYGWAFATDEMINAKIKKGYPAEIAYEYRSYSQNCLKRFVAFVNAVAKKQRFEIVVRPHPSITESQYQEVFEQELGQLPETVKLIKKYTIKEWIAVAAAVGSSWSTSVLDAHLCGKTSFLFTPYERPVWLNVEWNNRVPNISEPLELFKLLEGNASQNIMNNNDMVDSCAVVEQYAYRICEYASLFGHPRKQIVKMISKQFLKKEFSYSLLNSVSIRVTTKFVRPRGAERDYFSPVFGL